MMADGKIVIDIDGDSGALEKDVDSLKDAVSGKLEGVGNAVQKSIGGALSGLASGVLDALKKLTGWHGFDSIVTDALDVGMAFENSMSNVASLQKAANATDAQIKALKDTAEQFGATTQFSAAECADALGYMALAGWNAEDSIASLPGVLNLSAASGMGLAQASDMVTDYMSAFSKSVSDYTGEALTAAEFSDKLAFAQANSNTNVQLLGDAFKNCAANMNASGQQMDTVVSILGALANQGLKGSEAGTALSAVMRDINAKMQDGAITINGTSIAIADANGNYRDMIDIMADIEKATDGMTDTQKSAALSSVFTADSIKGMNLVLNAGTDSIREFEGRLSKCEGAAEEMAKTLNDNLEGDVKALSSAMDAVKNALYEGLEPAFRAIVQTITNNVAPALLDLTKGFFEMLNGVPEAENKVKSSLDSLLNWLTDSAQSVLPNILKTVVEGITKAIPDIVEGVMNVGQSVLDVVASLDVLSVIQSGIKNIGDRISHSNVIFRQATETMISGIVDALPAIIDSVFDIVEQMKQTLAQNFRSLKSQGKLLIENVLNGILDDVPKLLDMLTDVGWSISGIFTEIMPQMVDTAIALISTFGETIAQHSDKIGQSMQYFAKVMLEYLLDSIEGIGEAGKNWIEFLIGGIRDGLPKVLEAVGGIGEFIVSAISQIVPELLEVGTEILTAIIEGIGGALPDILQVGANVVMSLFNAIVGALPRLLGAGVETVETIVESIMKVLPDILETGAEIIVNLVSGIVKALPKLFATLTVMTSKLLDTLMKALPKLIEVGLNVINTLLTGIMDNLPLLIGSAVTLVSDFVRMILDNIPLLLDAGFQMLQGLLTAIMDNLPLLAESAVSLVMQLVTAILDNLPLLIDCALQLVDSLVNFIVENLEPLLDCAFQIVEAVVNGVLDNLDMILDLAVTVVQKLLEGFIKSESKIVEGAVKLFHAFIDWWNNNGSKIYETGRNLIVSLITGITKMIPKLLEVCGWGLGELVLLFEKIDWIQLGKDIIDGCIVGLRAMYQDLVNATTDLIDAIWTTIQDIDWLELGTNILDGIINGMKNIGNQISDWGESFVSGLADFFGIHSPSRLMRDEIGRYLGLGIGEGLTENLPDMAKISGEISDGFKPDLQFPEIPKPEIPDLTAPKMPDLQAPKFQMPDIDFEKISAQMRFATDAIGASAMPIMTTNNYYNNNSSTIENDNRIQNANAQPQQNGDIIIPVSIGGQQIETVIISALQLANLRSGGTVV